PSLRFFWPSVRRPSSRSASTAGTLHEFQFCPLVECSGRKNATSGSAYPGVTFMVMSKSWASQRLIHTAYSTFSISMLMPMRLSWARDDRRPRHHGREGRDHRALHAEAVGHAGLGHQLLRLLEVGLVVLHPLLLGQLPLLHGRRARRGEPPEAGGGDAHHLRAIDCPRDGLPHADVAERAAVGAHVQIVVPETRRPVAGQRLLVLEEIEILVVLDERVVHLPCAQRRHDLGLLPAY